MRPKPARKPFGDINEDGDRAVLRTVRKIIHGREIEVKVYKPFMSSWSIWNTITAMPSTGMYYFLQSQEY